MRFLAVAAATTGLVLSVSAQSYDDYVRAIYARDFDDSLYARELYDDSLHVRDFYDDHLYVRDLLDEGYDIVLRRTTPSRKNSLDTTVGKKIDGHNLPGEASGMKDTSVSTPADMLHAGNEEGHRKAQLAEAAAKGLDKNSAHRATHQGQMDSIIKDQNQLTKESGKKSRRSLRNFYDY